MLSCQAIGGVRFRIRGSLPARHVYGGRGSGAPHTSPKRRLEHANFPRFRCKRQKHVLQESTWLSSARQITASVSTGSCARRRILQYRLIYADDRGFIFMPCLPKERKRTTLLSFARKFYLPRLLKAADRPPHWETTNYPLFAYASRLFMRGTSQPATPWHTLTVRRFFFRLNQPVLIERYPLLFWAVKKLEREISDLRLARPPG